jgi:uncharacterized protein DUF6941
MPSPVRLSYWWPPILEDNRAGEAATFEYKCSQQSNNLTIDYYLERFFLSSRLRGIITIIVIIILSFSLLASLLLALQPVAAQGQIRLEAVSDQGTFRVEITWTPTNIGSPNRFDIRFIDPDTGSEIEDIKYDISIYSDDEPEIRRLDQMSTFQEFSFEEEGSYEIRIEDIEDLGEGVTIPIQVTPEFRLELFLFSAVALCVAVIAAKRNGNNLFRQPMN